MLFKYGSGTGTNLSTLRSSTRAARRRRHGVRPGVLHEGLRRLRRRHQERRQDAPRGQDGHPQRRPPGHPRVHPLQGDEEKKAWALIDAGYDAVVQRRGLLVGLLPEREQLGPRHRRVHEGGGRTTARGPTRAVRDGQADGHLPGARAVPRDRRGGAPVRRPGHAVRHHDQRAGTPARTPARINASNPCSEYMFLDDTACNLASLNLMKFRTHRRRVRRRGLQARGAT